MASSISISLSSIAGVLIFLVTLLGVLFGAWVGYSTWFGLVGFGGFPYFETDGKRVGKEGDGGGTLVLGLSLPWVLCGRRERFYYDSFLGFQRPLVWVWGVQSQPLPGVELCPSPVATLTNSPEQPCCYAHPNTTHHFHLSSSLQMQWDQNYYLLLLQLPNICVQCSMNDKDMYHVTIFLID
jgi:hypothetical protein